MRKAFSDQQRLDSRGVLGVELNFDCRDELIPVLRALQQIYSRPERCDQILDLIAQDVNQDARDDVGREGMDYWQILVLAAVRLGCNLDYDKLQDLAEQHRALRHIMGIGDWCEDSVFSWRRIRDNLCLLKPYVYPHFFRVRAPTPSTIICNLVQPRHNVSQPGRPSRLRFW